jgi:hypothetical protein
MPNIGPGPPKKLDEKKLFFSKKSGKKLFYIAPIKINKRKNQAYGTK